MEEKDVMNNEAKTIASMQDCDLIDYLNDLEYKTRQRTIDGDTILKKIDVINRQVRYRHNIDKKIVEKMNNIINML